VKVEANSNDITEYAHYDQSSIGMIFCCHLLIAIANSYQCKHW